MKKQLIDVVCHTNLDDYDCSIVIEMCIPPQIGHMVQVLYKGISRRYLTIQSITHMKGSTLLLELY